MQNARTDSGGQGDVFRADAPEAVFRAFAEGVEKDAEPLAREVRKLLALIDAGDEAGAAAFAATLGANIGDYLPDDPAGAMALAEAMAERYGEAWEAARGGSAASAPSDAGLANSECRAKDPAHCPTHGTPEKKDGGTSGSPSGTTEAKKIEVGSVNADSHEEQEKQLAKAATAFEKCLSEQVDVPNAFHRSDIGDIDLRWGKTNKGLKHMIERRDAFAASHPGALDGRAVLSRMPETIIKGTVTEVTQSGGHPHIVIERDGFRAIITRDREGGNHWFFSGYEISEAGRGYRAKK